MGVSRRTARAAAQEGSRRLVLSFYNGSIALQRRILSRYERSVNRVACPSRGSISSLGFLREALSVWLSLGYEEVDFLLLENRDSPLEPLA